MKRYTAKILLKDSQVTPDQVKSGLEQVLLRAPRPVPYRLGVVVEIPGGELLAEIATDIGRENLLQFIKKLESNLPVQVERLGWGWLVTGSQPVDSTNMMVGLRIDPYLASMPQTEPSREYRYDPWQRFRFWAAIFFYLVLLVAVVTIVLPVSSLQHSIWNLVYWLSILFWILLAAIDLPLPFSLWRQANCIRCDRDGIEVDYLLHSRPARIEWPDVQELQISGTRGIVRSRDRFLVFQNFQVHGIKDRSTLIKSIINRASLQFVGTNVGSVTYKKFDA